MAKVRVRRIKNENATKSWQSIFEGLKEAVLTDKVACPELEFQRHEASYDRRLEEPIREVIDDLSYGLKFHHSRDILESQIYDAATNFLGRQPRKKERWTIAFRSDPQAPVESRTVDILGFRGRINVHLSFSDEIVEHDRRLKSEFANSEVLPILNQNSQYSWNELLKREKISFIYSLMGLSLLHPEYQKWRQQWYSSSPLSKSLAAAQITELKDFWEKLAQVGINIDDPAAVADFLLSEELLNIPYIDIFCSIHAAIKKHNPNRKARESDFYDIQILSTVLPYCDIVTTDKFMKEILIKKLQFDKKYNTRIFSATKADGLEFQKSIRELDGS